MPLRLDPGLDASDLPGSEAPAASRTRRRLPRWAPLCVALIAAVVIPPILTAACWRYVNEVPPFTPSLPVPPASNGYDRAAALLRNFKGSSLFTESRWKQASAAQLAPVVSGIAPKANAVRSTFSQNWQLPAEVVPAEYSPFSAMATYFAAESRWERLCGRPGAALRCSLDAVEWGRCNSEQGYQVLGVEQAELCVGSAPLPGLEEQLRRVRRLRTTWPRATGRVEARRQRALVRLTAMLEANSHNNLWEQLDLAQRFSSSSRGSASPQLFNHDWETWKCVLTPRAHSVAVLERYYAALKDRAGAPVRDGYGPPEPDDRWAAQYTGGQMGGYRWEWPRHNLALLETALAVRIFRLRHDRYPTNVSQIDHDLLPEVPLDIWEQPVVVRLRKGRPLIYSIARDGVDDGGRPGKPDSFAELGTGDSVWGMLCDADWPSRRK